MNDLTTKETLPAEQDPHERVRSANCMLCGARRWHPIRFMQHFSLRCCCFEMKIVCLECGTEYTIERRSQ